MGVFTNPVAPVATDCGASVAFLGQLMANIMILLRRLKQNDDSMEIHFHSIHGEVTVLILILVMDS